MRQAIIGRVNEKTHQPADIFTVVLTGGIASGKTAVSELFTGLGVPVIDTDVIARQVVEPGQPALAKIAGVFGAEYIDTDGRLNRRRMRHAIFSDPKIKERLEGILHPLIAEETRRQIGKLNAPYCILVIPLFTESERYKWVDRVLVVDVEESLQIERVMKRDGVDRRHAEAILAAQADRRQRRAIADDLIDNSGSMEDLATQVERLHDRYCELASSRT